MKTVKDLKAKVKALPLSAGVYIFKDRQGQIIYIGKAKSLKKRVQSYFSRFLTAKTQAMVAKIDDVEYVLAPTETKAALLESVLIKKEQPHYNVSFKDDKSFPLIKMSDETFPVISICRRKKSDQGGARYLGPFTDAQGLRQALKMVRRIFGFRSCTTMPQKACLYYRLRLCPAPCIGKIDAQAYRTLIEHIQLFLESRYEELVVALTKKMRDCASKHDFEMAATLRDQIAALSVFGQHRGYVGGMSEVEDLKNLLGIEILPERIEAFDISNFSGKQATGSMVSFYRGMPDKNRYRKFRIKEVKGIDDYAMLREVVRRRYERVLREGLPLPDLVLIDGGKTHLLAALEVIQSLGLQVYISSFAKGQEDIYVCTPTGVRHIRLGVETPALNLIRRIRDEAHRFAVTYHRLLRRKRLLGR